jgi:CRP/FNR family cyclic AMP-dependent transcriptional regulator
MTAVADDAPLPPLRDVLRGLPVLGLLDEDQLSQVVAVSRVVRYPKRATVVFKGREVDHWAFLISGKLQVVDYLPDGREFGLNIIQAGKFYGELSVIDRQPRSASLVALSPAVVVQVPGDITRRLFYDHPPIAEAMMKHFAFVVRRMSDLRALQAMPNAFQRVFALLSYVKEEGPGGLQVIHDMPTHQEIAIMVNTSRETVTRALGMLKRAGALRKESRHAVISDPEVLRRLIEKPE